MSEKPDGGPAYPCREATNAPNEGMTLRDYFAAKAMAAVLVNASLSDPPAMGLIAAAAYLLADAMLKERDK